MEEKKKDSHPFIRYLLDLSPEKDRGILADLRKGFSKDSAIRAWTHIGRFCRLDSEERIIFQTVAAGYATNPVNDDTSYANFGSVMKKLVHETVGNDETKRQSFDTTFRRLLGSETTEEICQRLRSPILVTKAKNIPIPWESLFWDLKKWGEDVKVKWASKYWEVPREMENFESEDVDKGEESDNGTDESSEEDEE